MAAAPVLGTGLERGVGSSPTWGTKHSLRGLMEGQLPSKEYYVGSSPAGETNQCVRSSVIEHLLLRGRMSVVQFHPNVPV